MTTDPGRADRAPAGWENAADQRAERHLGTALVVGHDGHPANNIALITAITLAERLGAHLHVIHSITLEDFGVDPDIEAFEQECDRNLAREREFIADTLASTTVGWTYHETRGDPAARIAQLANTVDATLIVVGMTHAGVVHQLISGSVPRRLLHTQTRPVLVVPSSKIRQ